MKDKSDTKPPVVDSKSIRKSVTVDKSKAFEAVEASDPIKDKAGKLIKDKD